MAQAYLGQAGDGSSIYADVCTICKCLLPPYDDELVDEHYRWHSNNDAGDK